MAETKATIEQAIDFAKKQSKEIVESGEEHIPIMIALAPEDAGIIPLVDMDKDRFKEDVSVVLRLLDAYAYVFVNEAWVARLPKDSPTVQRVFNGEVKVSELPLDDRIEMLTVAAAENGKSYRMWSAKIRHTPEGKRYLGEWEEMRGIPVMGRLVLKEW